MTSIYVADSESGSVAKDHSAWKRGIRVGRPRTARSRRSFRTRIRIPLPRTSAAEGVAADANGVIYGAEVAPKDVKDTSGSNDSRRPERKCAPVVLR